MDLYGCPATTLRFCLDCEYSPEGYTFQEMEEILGCAGYACSLCGACETHHTNGCVSGGSSSGGSSSGGSSSGGSSSGGSSSGGSSSGGSSSGGSSCTHAGGHEWYTQEYTGYCGTCNTTVSGGERRYCGFCWAIDYERLGCGH